MAEKGFIETITDLLDRWTSSSKEHQQEFLAISKRKYTELESTHAFFIKSMEGLKYALPKDRADFEKVYEFIMSKRLEGRQTRLSQYEEASLYIDSHFANRYRVFKTVPEPIVCAFRGLMLAYCDYFSRDRNYHHDLLSAMVMIESRVLGKMPSDIGRLRLEVGEILAQHIQDSETKWSVFSRAYFNLSATIADHGVFSG